MFVFDQIPFLQRYGIFSLPALSGILYHWNVAQILERKEFPQYSGIVVGPTATDSTKAAAVQYIHFIRLS